MRLKDTEDVKKDIKQKGIKNEKSQVNSTYYTVKDHHTDNKTEDINEETTSITASDFEGDILSHQLNTINKIFEINMKLLESGFGSPKNKDKRRSYRKSHNKEEMIKIWKKKWQSVMQDLRTNILFLDFVENYYPKLKNLNVLTKIHWTKHDKSFVKASHPPSESIVLTINDQLVIAFPFKNPKDEKDRRIIEQNNYTNRCLNVIGDQLDKIETKIDN